MTTRAEYATAKEGDVARLRDAFEQGRAFTKEHAREDFGIAERPFRAAVAELRAQGYPVISSSDASSTYRKAKDRAELDRFIQSEVNSRRMQLERQERALRRIGPTWLKAQTDLFGE